MTRTTAIPLWMLAVLLCGMAATSGLLIARTASSSRPAVPVAAPREAAVPQAAAPPAAVTTDQAAEVQALKDEIDALSADLAQAQRDSATLQGLSQQQQQDLSQTQNALQSSAQERQAQVQDLQTRLKALEDQVSSVEQLAAEMRKLLGMPDVGGPAGGPPGASTADPEAATRTMIANDQARVAALKTSFDQINARAQARLAAASVVPLPSATVPASQVAFAPYIPRGQPVYGPITSVFGERSNPFVASSGSGTADASATPTAASVEFHTGFDIAVPQGTPVKVTGAGVVRVAGMSGSYGNLVVIDHGRGISTYYGHNSKILVTVGQQIQAGDVIALSGNTGRSTGPHVHYEIRIDGNSVDPAPYMKLSP